MIILILGSGPSAVRAMAWDRAPFDRIVAVNNAWRLRDDWDDLIYPYDFPPNRMPPQKRDDQRFVDETAFVPAQNTYGGFLFAGATMAFTATYWALHALRPRVIAYLGCDMVYPSVGPTHFYGAGTADPLRADVSLRSLEAKSARALCFAASQGCALVNLSHSESRLVFPRATKADLGGVSAPSVDDRMQAEALRRERALDYRTPTGFHDHIAPDIAALDAIDGLWLRAAQVGSRAGEQEAKIVPHL